MVGVDAIVTVKARLVDGTTSEPHNQKSTRHVMIILLTINIIVNQSPFKVGCLQECVHVWEKIIVTSAITNQTWFCSLML